MVPTLLANLKISEMSRRSIRPSHKPKINFCEMVKHSGSGSGVEEERDSESHYDVKVGDSESGTRVEEERDTGSEVEVGDWGL